MELELPEEHSQRDGGLPASSTQHGDVLCAAYLSEPDIQPHGPNTQSQVALSCAVVGMGASKLLIADGFKGGSGTPVDLSSSDDLIPHGISSAVHQTPIQPAKSATLYWGRLDTFPCVKHHLTCLNSPRPNL